MTKVFDVILTRDCTESVVVKVKANTKGEARARAIENVPEDGWDIDDGNIRDEFYVTGVDESYMPEWAETEILDGSYLHVRASLPTKDGRACGNAVVVEIVNNKFDGKPLATVITDAGNILKLNENELKHLFHPPQYIMRSLLLTHLHAWSAEENNQK